MGMCLAGAEGGDDKIKGQLHCIILGVAGSGKSTFTKQLRLLDNQAWSATELEDFRNVIRRDLLIGLQELILRCDKLKLEIAGENKKYARIFIELDVSGTDISEIWDTETSNRVRALWPDPAIQKAYEASSGLQTQVVHLRYLMDKLDEIVKEDYVPHNDDILRLRMRTTTVTRTSVVADKYQWVFVDCGGQKNERAKWSKILSSEKYRALIYVVAIDEFNVVAAEDESQTKFQTSLKAFEELWNDDTQKQNFCIILLFSKIDLFSPKFKASPEAFKASFPEFEGATETEAVDFLSAMFQSKLPQHFQMSAKTVNSLDGDLTKVVFNDMRLFAISNRLKQTGLGI